MNSGKNQKHSVKTLVPIIVKAARTGDYAECSSVLNTLLVLLQKELSSGNIPIKDISTVTYSLETLAQMQQMENWVAFADILEYELFPLWQKIMDGIRRDNAQKASSPPAS